MNGLSFQHSIVFVTLLGCLLSYSSNVWFVSSYSQQRHLTTKPRTSPTAPSSDQTETVDRRAFFDSMMPLVAVGLTAATIQPQLAGAVISSKYCAYGEGKDCEDLAGGNAYILELQRKSAANKQASIDSAKNAFYAKNYPDWFAAVGKTMVQKESDGTFIVVDNEELAKLWEDNKISVKTPTTMGGRIKDVTQKPMLVLKDEKADDTANTGTSKSIAENNMELNPLVGDN